MPESPAVRRALAKVAEYANLPHLEAMAECRRGKWVVMLRRRAGGDWFQAPRARA